MIKSGFDWLNNPFDVMSKQCARSGSSFNLRLPQLGNVLVTGNPSHIKQLVKSDQFHAGAGVRALSLLLGSKSVICLDGTLHQRRHKLLTHYFYSDTIYTLDEALMNHCKQALSTIKPGTHFNFYTFSQSALLVIALRQILGDIQPSLMNQIKATMQAIHNTKIHPMFLFLKPIQMKLWGYSAWGQLITHQQALRKLLRRTIHTHHRVGNNFLTYILTQDSRYYSSEEELIDEVMALLFFAHETTAASIAMIADYLLRYDFTKEQVEDIHFIQACIKEGMRLKPVVPHLTRICQRAQSLGNSQVSKDQWIFPSSFIAHFNADVFPEPERFKPERFMSGKTYPYHSFPFGLGERMCIGKKLAERHMEIILYEIFSALRFAKLPQTPSKSQKRLVVMLPADLNAAKVVGTTSQLQSNCSVTLQ